MLLLLLLLLTKRDGSSTLWCRAVVTEARQSSAVEIVSCGSGSGSGRDGSIKQMWWDGAIVKYLNGEVNGIVVSWSHMGILE